MVIDVGPPVMLPTAQVACFCMHVAVDGLVYNHRLMKVS